MKRFSYNDVKGVNALEYRPCYTEDDYVFWFDSLLVYYADKQQKPSIFNDWNIISFLEAIERYSICDISMIWNEIEAKKRWYIKQEPYHPNLPNQYINFEQGVYFLLSKASQQGKVISFDKQRERLKQFCKEKKLCNIGEFLCDDYDYRCVFQEIVEANEKKAIDIVLMAIGKYQERRFDISLYWELAKKGIRLETVYIWEDIIK